MADQIRARGEMRVDVAKGLDEGEEKIARAQNIAKKAAELEKDAAKAEKRAQSYADEAKKLRAESAKLQKESEQLTAAGTAQVNEAIDAYHRIKELPKIEMPGTSTQTTTP